MPIHPVPSSTQRNVLPAGTIRQKSVGIQFDQWAEKRYDRRFLAPPDQSSKHASLSLTSTEAPKPRTLLRDQEKAIIACISSLGFDPKQLPKKSPGKGGVKKQVRDNLDGNSLFKGVTVFDRAWERLRKSGAIGCLKRV